MKYYFRAVIKGSPISQSERVFGGVGEMISFGLKEEFPWWLETL